MKMKKWISIVASSVLVASVVVGCSNNAPAPQNSKKAATPSADGAKFLLASEPSGAKSVIDARKDGKNDDEIVIVGRIGGSESPWIDRRAAFSIVDNSLKACTDIPGDTCKTPWDYCCQTDQLPTSTALVKVVDDSGKVVDVDARELLNVKELQTVVVRGKAQRDAEGNLTVLASGIYVKK
jgi:hypothetical protein